MFPYFPIPSTRVITEVHNALALINNLLAPCPSYLLFEEISWTLCRANERLLRPAILSPIFSRRFISKRRPSLGLFADLRLSELINPSTQKSGKVEGNLEHWPSADAHQRGKNETEIVEMEKKRQV